MNLSSLKQIDNDWSYKIAHLLDLDGRSRRFIQILTLTGTAFAWWIGLIIAYFFTQGLERELYSMFIINTIMTVIVYLLKLSFKRPRPEFRDDRMGTVSFDIFSFPSGHATRAVYVSILMPIYIPELTLFWYIWSLVMICSRLLIGVHYLSDIFAGMILGMICMGLFAILGWIPIFPFSDILL